MTIIDAHAVHRRYLAQKYFGSLDGIRALSIIAVIWHHSGPSLPYKVTHFGFLGVDWFFVLSGFLIVTLLLRERDRHGQISLIQFYVRRFLRLFPLYYGLLVALSVLALVHPGSATGSQWFNQLPILLTYTANWFTVTSIMAIAWSLAAEEQFYLVWPPIEKFARQWALPALALAAIVTLLIQFGMVDGVMAHLGFGPGQPRMLRETTFLPILLGVLLAHAFHSVRGYALGLRFLNPRWVAPVLLITVLFVLVVAPNDLRGWARPTIQVTLALLLAACVVREDHGLAWLLRWALLQRIGVISYGLYLLHLFGLHGANGVRSKLPMFDSDWVLFPLTLVFSIILAEVSFRYYEMPFLRIKERFSRAPQAPQR